MTRASTELYIASGFMLIFKELFLALACFVYSCVRGLARIRVEERENPRVVIVQFAKLGDMVCTTQVFRAVKEKYPHAHLTVVGDSINKEVLKHNADIDEYVVFEGILPLVRHLRTAAYDFGATPTPSMAALVTMFLGKVRTIVVPRVENGTSPLESFFYRITRILVIQKPHRMWHYAAREYLRILEPLGIISEDTGKHLGFSQPAITRVQELFKDIDERSLWIGMSPSSGFKPKNWGSKKFAALADKLASDSSVTIVVFGGARDKEETATMLNAMSKNTPALDLSGKLSLDELKAAISLMDLFVSSDTGPIYIAEAFGVPTVDILGAIAEEEAGPRGPMHVFVIPPGPRVAQLHIMNPRRFDAAEAARQIEAIGVEAVYAACKDLLSRLSNPISP